MSLWFQRLSQLSNSPPNLILETTHSVFPANQITSSTTVQACMQTCSHPGDIQFFSLYWKLSCRLQTKHLDYLYSTVMLEYHIKIRWVGPIFNLKTWCQVMSFIYRKCLSYNLARKLRAMLLIFTFLISFSCTIYYTSSHIYWEFFSYMTAETFSIFFFFFPGIFAAFRKGTMWV